MTWSNLKTVLPEFWTLKNGAVYEHDYCSRESPTVTFQLAQGLSIFSIVDIIYQLQLYPGDVICWILVLFSHQRIKIRGDLGGNEFQELFYVERCHKRHVAKLGPVNNFDIREAHFFPRFGSTGSGSACTEIDLPPPSPLPVSVLLLLILPDVQMSPSCARQDLLQENRDGFKGLSRAVKLSLLYLHL